MSSGEFRIDLNSDLGEGFGTWSKGPDDALMQIISSANVACGFHAGDPLIMEETVALAKENGVSVGAHPGYPDRVGFGRRTMAASFDEVRTDVFYQIAALDGFCRKHSVELRHVKAHGALYNLAVHDATTAAAIAEAVKSYNPDLLFFALPGSELEAAGISAGLTVMREAFADRAYMPDGSLVPRSQPGAVITDLKTITARMVKLVTEGSIETIEGTKLTIRADTICLHSDTPDSLEIAEAIYAQFQRSGISIHAVGMRAE